VFRSICLRPLELLLLFCSFLAVRALLHQGLEPLGVYDEGLLFTNAQMMMDGHVPYRDFYSNYPPGIFQVVRFVMTLSSAPVWTMRLLALGVRLASAFGAAWLVGRVRRGPPCLATATVVLVLQSRLGLVPYGYTFAVLLLLTTIATWPPPSAPRWQRVASGILVGCLSYLRHDLFVYVMVPWVAVEALWWIARKRSLFFGRPRELADFAIGGASTAVVLWLPIFLHADFSRVVHDLALDQVALVMPARTLPIPPLNVVRHLGALNLTLPDLLVDPFLLALLLTAIGIGAAVYAAIRALRASGNLTSESRLATLVAVCAVATLPQALGRTDYWHVAFGLPLVLAAAFSMLGRRVAQLVALVALLPWFAQKVPFIGIEDAMRLWRADDTAFITKERSDVTQFVQSQTRRGEPIFVGCVSHRRIVMNALDVYYLAQRPGATRYMQFDPGLATTLKGQSEMVRDLKRTQPHLVLRSAFCLLEEPNASRFDGSGLLDDYLSATYELRDVVGSFQVWKRKAVGYDAKTL
jgi:hypothetical protein